MKKYAIVKLLGKQYKLSEGDQITVDRVPHEEKETFDVDEVLLKHDGKKAVFGQPLVKNAVVTFKVKSVHQSKKIRVATYKAKSRYRRVKGHKQMINTLEVVKIK